MIALTTFQGRHVAVFGLARSGIVAAEALRAGGAVVACWDDGEAGRAAAVKAGLPLVDLTTADWSQFAALVLAPGVPLTHPAPHWTVTKAHAAGVDVIGDIELFFRERAKIAPASPVVAITGTNGKSTTTALTAHVLRAAGRDVQMGGNIGVGVLSLAAPAQNRIHVLELSSFQIDLTPTLNPTVGMLLNVTPDHLDRHGTLDNYARIKARITEHANLSIIGIDELADRSFCGHLFAALNDGANRVAAFSRRETPPSASIVSHAGQTLVRNGETIADLSGVGSLRGGHNMENAAAAYLACEFLGLANAEIVAGLKSYPGLAHRMEQLGHIGKVLVINDSKATNADSTEKALTSFPRDIYWIAGGTPKEGGIAPLAPYFDRIAKAYLVGVCAPDFAATLDGKIAYEISQTLDVALAAATRDATASAAREPVVLLSPACASYDQYKSFEHRGDHFRQLAAASPGFVAIGTTSRGNTS